MAIMQKSICKRSSYT